jgi:glutamate N-acetyltransferase/amino-acid N-acetyltransferase
MMEVSTEFVMPKGFQAAGAHVGIKKDSDKKDLALLVSDYPAEFAVALTTNVVKAAPILWNQKIDQCGKKVKAIVCNSGNANACTGAAGIAHNEEMAAQTAVCIGAQNSEILVASTGVIGVTMPIEVVNAGIQKLAPQLKSYAPAGIAAAEAIMTTDSFAKYCTIQTVIGGKIVTITGMAKGSGMIHPNMATMLSFVLTDATISKALLHKALIDSVQVSYNMISVDGDTSTNDMVAVLANGASGAAEIVEGSDDWKNFAEALNAVNTYLAKSIARDGEGATKLLTVTVKGSKNIQEAQKLSKSVVSSNLVKTAMFGEDANWGRIVAALGYGGVAFDPAKVSVQMASDAGVVSLLSSGEPCTFSEDLAAAVMKKKDIEVLIDLNDGLSWATAWGCDLSYDYIRINGAYRT